MQVIIYIRSCKKCKEWGDKMTSTVDLEKIKMLRKQSKLSQDEMAKKLGFNSVYPYHRKESGKQPFTADEIHIIAKMFNKHIEYFFFNKLANNASSNEKKEVG